MQRSDEEMRRIMGHQSERWQLIEDQRNPQFRITKHKIEADPLKIFEDMSEEANTK